MDTTALQLLICRDQIMHQAYALILTFLITIVRRKGALLIKPEQSLEQNGKKVLLFWQILSLLCIRFFISDH